MKYYWNDYILKSVYEGRFLIGLSLTYGDASERPNWDLLGKKLKYSIHCLTAHNLRAKERKRNTVFVLKHTLRRSRFTLPSLWVVFSLSKLSFKLHFFANLLAIFYFSMPIPIDICSNNLKKKTLKNDSHFALREDRPSLFSLVSHSSQLPHSPHASALSLLLEASTQRARKHYPRDNRYVLKITFEGLRWVEGLCGGLILWALFFRGDYLSKTPKFPHPHPLSWILS